MFHSRRHRVRQHAVEEEPHLGRKRNVFFCPSYEKFNSVVLEGVGNIPDAPKALLHSFTWSIFHLLSHTSQSTGISPANMKIQEAGNRLSVPLHEKFIRGIILENVINISDTV